MCVVTPQRPPQCNRPFEMIKTGALYAYDDMTNIHHSRMHRDINSFRMIEKGKCLDALRGEWEGVNAAAAELTQGRTTRIQLHCIDEFPHTGCGCFRLIMFKTDLPKPGIGIMDASLRRGDRRTGGAGRTCTMRWRASRRRAWRAAVSRTCRARSSCRPTSGWSSVVWVSPKVAGIFGGRPPKGIMVGQ